MASDTPTPIYKSVSDPIRGALWMIAAGVLLSAMNVLVRFATTELHPFEVAFFRNLGQLAFMLPWLMVRGIGIMRTTRIKGHFLRSLTGLAAMLAWFSALSLMPVPDATAISFTAPLFATLGAALFLGETVRARRWTATLIGFIGMLIILRPGLQEFGLPQILALLAAGFMAASALLIKTISRTDSPNVMVLYMGLFMSILSLPPALLYWTWPSIEMTMWMVVIGATATGAHLCLNRAFAVADASAVAPFDFMRLPAAVVISYLVFGETPDLWTWVGGGVIFTAGAYIARRELHAHRAVPATSAPDIAAPDIDPLGKDRTDSS